MFSPEHPDRKRISFPWFSEKVHTAQGWIIQLTSPTNVGSLIEKSAISCVASVGVGFVGINVLSEPLVGVGILGLGVSLTVLTYACAIKFAYYLNDIQKDKQENRSDRLIVEEFYLTDPKTGKPNPESYLFN